MKNNENQKIIHNYKVYISSVNGWILVIDEVNNTNGKVSPLDYTKCDDSLDMKSIAEDKDLLAVLHENQMELEPDSFHISKSLMEGKTEHDMESVKGFTTQSSISHRKRKIFNQLRTFFCKQHVRSFLQPSSAGQRDLFKFFLFKCLGRLRLSVGRVLTQTTLFKKMINMGEIQSVLICGVLILRLCANIISLIIEVKKIIHNEDRK